MNHGQKEKAQEMKSGWNTKTKFAQNLKRVVECVAGSRRASLSEIMAGAFGHETNNFVCQQSPSNLRLTAPLTILSVSNSTFNQLSSLS